MTPLTSSRIYWSNRAESAAAPATCERCGRQIPEEEKPQSYTNHSEDGSMCDWTCAPCHAGDEATQIEADQNAPY